MGGEAHPQATRLLCPTLVKGEKQEDSLLGQGSDLPPLRPTRSWVLGELLPSQRVGGPSGQARG